MSEILEAVLATEAEGEEAVRKALEEAGVSEKGMEGAIGAFRTLQAFKDELNEDNVKGILKAAGFDPEEEEEGEEEGDENDPSEEKVAKSLDDLPADVRAMVEKSFKAQVETQKQLDDVQKQLDTERETRLNKFYVEKAENSFAHIPGDSAELGDTLRKIHALDSELGNAVEKALEGAEKMIAEGTVMNTQGAVKPVGAGDAWAQIETLAQERVTKGLDSDKHKAISAVINENPELYNEYLGETQGA